MSKYAIGLDYGTLSVRALMIDIQNGEEIAVSVYEYPHGVMGDMLPTGEALPVGFALHHPQDYLDGLTYVVRGVMEKSGVRSEDVVGLGIDCTAATILPTTKEGTPLCMLEEFKTEPHAYIKLWKHHGAEAEANEMDRVIAERGEDWISLYGGKVSSEWAIPKILETLHHAPTVYEKADRFIEAMDWLVWCLTGKETRAITGYGYKAFYNHRNGHPSNEFFKALDSRMDGFWEKKMEAPIKKMGETAGYVTKEMADRLGLCEGTPVGTAMIDAHSCVIGSGLTGPGEMVIIVGTSYCHHVMAEEELDVYGIGGMVKDGLLPGYFAYEAGQSGGGDIFDWLVKNCIPERYEVEAREKGIGIHQLLCEKLEGYEVGSSGLIALDWFNGVRSPLADFNLNGLLLGMNLQTKPEELYMALIEATGFGTRLIVEECEKAGVPIKSVVLSGGIPLKNPMLVQVFSDILNKDIDVCQTTQAGALGSAMLGIAAASSDITGYSCLKEVVKKLGKRKEKVCCPNEENVKVYHQLFEEYKVLHKYFGKGTNDVMKRLNQMRNS
jgi:L-ribulokinase